MQARAEPIWTMVKRMDDLDVRSRPYTESLHSFSTPPQPWYGIDHQMACLIVVRGRYPNYLHENPWILTKGFPIDRFLRKTAECPLLSQSFVFNNSGEDPLPDLASWISAIWHSTCRYFFHVETMPKTAPWRGSPYCWVLFLFFSFFQILSSRVTKTNFLFP